jgi:soluble lytic murein transglycosylase-like protein
MLITLQRTMDWCHPKMISGKKSALVFIMMALIVMSSSKTIAAPLSVRDAIYSSNVMKKYNGYKQCIYWEAKNNRIDELVLMSVIMAEYGDKSTSSINTDGTNDYGIMQINDVRREQVISLGFDPELIKSDGCYNIKVGSRLLANEIQNAGGNLWVGIGRYHYHEKGEYPHNHYKYRTRVASKLQRLVGIASATKRTY